MSAVWGPGQVPHVIWRGGGHIDTGSGGAAVVVRGGYSLLSSPQKDAFEVRERVVNMSMNLCFERRNVLGLIERQSILLRVVILGRNACDIPQ